MKCCIVVNAYIKNNSQIMQAERIAEELRNMGVGCDIVKNVHLAEIKNGNAVAFNYDCCVFLDKDKSAARLLEKCGVKLINSANSVEVCDNKMLTHIALANCGVPMPDCVYAPLCYYPDAEVSDEFLNGVERKLGFPLVAKKCYGSLGMGVYMICDRAELLAFEENNKLSEHFYQKFIGRGGEDIRVIVIGGKYFCAMKRRNENDFRSNVGQGGHGEKYEADDEIIDLCEKVAKLLNLDYCGIDILTDEEGNRYVCEVNSNAFFEEAERICKVNIAKEFANTIINKWSI